jgi:hypothetical protein
MMYWRGRLVCKVHVPVVTEKDRDVIFSAVSVNMYIFYKMYIYSCETSLIQYMSILVIYLLLAPAPKGGAMVLGSVTSVCLSVCLSVRTSVCHTFRLSGP